MIDKEEDKGLIHHQVMYRSISKVIIYWIFFSPVFLLRVSECNGLYYFIREI